MPIIPMKMFSIATVPSFRPYLFLCPSCFHFHLCRPWCVSLLEVQLTSNTCRFKMVGEARFERAVSCSQGRRVANYAIPRNGCGPGVEPALKVMGLPAAPAAYPLSMSPVRGCGRKRSYRQLSLLTRAGLLDHLAHRGLVHRHTGRHRHSFHLLLRFNLVNLCLGH